MDTLLLIDGNAIMHRAFHAIPPFKTSKGTPTNVMYGFFAMLHKAIQDYQPTHVAIAFDTPAKTFRQKMNAEYQAHRPDISDDFKVQIPLLKDLIDKAGIYHEELDGYEADDVIGSITQKAKEKHMRTLILTGDKDIMQLVNSHVFVLAPQTGLSHIKVYTEDEVVKKLGIKPHSIPDYKALAGDPSDNYTGAKGIGPKTAIKLIEKYATIENLYKQLDTVEEKRTKQLLEDNRDNVIMSKDIATIRCDIPLRFSFEKAEFKGFPDTLKDELETYEMRSLKARIFHPDSLDTKKPKGVRKSDVKKNKEEKTKDQISMF